MLPDCECKGRAFLHSLQEIAEKNCEKISFAPILPLHSIAKSAVKPIFSPLPHPTFFAPKSPFFPLFPVLDSISGTFSRNCARFLPCKAHFFSSCLVLGPTSSDFSRNISRFYLRLPHFQFMLPPSSLPPPLSFSFLPTFPSPSPIYARSCAPSRTTRVRVRPHLPARQEVFVYCLHRFTHPSQPTVHQRVRGEGK